MSTEYIDLEGEGYWLKITKPDEFRGSVRWALNLALDEPSLKIYQDSGIQKKLKNTAEAKNVATLLRPTTKLMKGKMVYFTPPIVYGKDGETLRKYVDKNGETVRSYDTPGIELTKVGDIPLIGNGSKLKVTLSVYDTQMGKGHRLESIKLLDLIEYVKPEEPAQEGKAADIEW